MKFIPVTERLPQQGDLYHVNIRMIDGDGTTFPAAINFYGKEWEMSGDGYEVVEWLDKSTAPTPSLSEEQITKIAEERYAIVPENEFDHDFAAYQDHVDIAKRLRKAFIAGYRAKQ